MNARHTGLATLALATALTAQPATVTVPNGTATAPGNAGALYPWGLDSPFPTANDIAFLQVIDPSNFTNQGVAGPIVITTLTWRASDAGAAWVGGTHNNVQITLGEARFPFDSISLGFEANYAGGRPAASYAGAVRVNPSAGGGTGIGPDYVTVTLDVPFVYEPANSVGLVVEVRHDGDWTPNTGTAGGSFAVSAVTPAFVPTPACSHIFSNDWTARFAAVWVVQTGLVVTFDYRPFTGPVVAFTAGTSTAGPGQPVTFNDASVTPNPPLTAWAWDFDNDGTVDSTQQNPVGVFATCGPQATSLTVTDSLGLTGTLVRTGVVETVPPVASFTQSTFAAPAPVTVVFTDTSTNAPLFWDWDFDADGLADSTQQNPQWTFTQQELVPISLTAGNTCGTTTAESTVDARSVVCVETRPRPANRWSIGGDGGGAMYDLTVTNPAGITITGVETYCNQASTGIAMELWLTPGGFAGKEQSPPAWVLASQGTGDAPVGDAADPTVFSLTVPVCLQPGVYGMFAYYTSTTAASVSYAASTLSSSSTPDVQLSGGTVTTTRFGVPASPPDTASLCLGYRVGVALGTVSAFRPGCANNASGGFVADLSSRNGVAPTIGFDFPLELRNAPPSDAGSAIWIGLTTPGAPFDVTGIPLSLIGADGCFLHVDPVLAIIPSPTDAAGFAGVDIPVPDDPQNAGLPFFVVAVSLDTPGPIPRALPVALSNTARCVIGTCP